MGTQQPHPSQEDPGLKMVGGWKSIEVPHMLALLLCSSIGLSFWQLLGTQYWGGMLQPSEVSASSQGCTDSAFLSCFSHSQIVFICMHIAQESCKRYSSPDCWLSVDTEVSASQVLLRTLHAVCVLNSGFRCFGDD